MALLSFAVLALIAIPTTAQECSGPGWQVYDDGIYENGYGSSSVLFLAAGAMLQDDFSDTVRVTSACVCFQRAGADSTVIFDLFVWDSDRADGGPGSELGKLPLQAMVGVPFGVGGKRQAYDVSSLDIVTDRPYYVGVKWDPDDDDDFFLCSDESTSTPMQRGFFSAGLTTPTPTVEMGNLGAAPTYRAFGFRSKTEPVVNEDLCTPNETTLCLGNGRFRVTATFEDATRQDDAMARAFPDIDDSGLFWFYSAGNLEMLVKILNGCPINDRFWVFFAATTDVGFELTIEDLEAGTSKVYTNDFGNRANAVTDTDAFATCSF